MKKGEIYKVLDYDNNPHKVVLMEDYLIGMKEIKAVALTHDSVGGKYISNVPMLKEYFEETDTNGQPYPFQWERLADGRVTSIMTTGFNKPHKFLKEECLGKVNEDGLKYIESKVERYIKCPVAAGKYKGEHYE